MVDDKKDLPEPPKFDVEDLPEPPKLDLENNIPALKEPIHETVQNEEIPPPPQHQDKKMDEIPAPPKKKGFLSFLKKKTKPVPMVEEVPALPEMHDVHFAPPQPKDPEWFKEATAFREKEMEVEAQQFREEEMIEEGEKFVEETPLTEIKGVGKKRAKKLKKAGIKTAEHVAKQKHKHIAKKLKIPEPQAKKLVSHAKKITKIKSRLKKTKPKDISGVIKQLEDERKTIKVMSESPLDEEKLIEIEGHKDIINVLDKLESKRRELIDQEKILADREIKLAKHDDVYKRDLEHLEKLKRRLDHDIRERTQYLINLEKEYFQRAQTLAKKQSGIEIQETEFAEKEKFIKEKEIEIKKRINEIEDRDITLTTKEKKFETLMKDLETQDTELREKEDDLLKREEEYTKKLDILENHEQNVLKSLEDKRKGLESKEKEIEIRERRIRTKERSVDKRKVAMEYAEDIIEEEKSKLVDDQFDQYLHDQIGLLKNSGINVSDINVVKNISLPNLGESSSKIYDLIDMCKEMLSNQRVNEAKVYYNQLRDKYYNAKFKTQQEREAIHNTIRTLYDEINLADIGKD